MNQAIALATQAGQIDQRGEWLWPIGLEKPIMRTPDQDDEPRPIERISRLKRSPRRRHYWRGRAACR
ncbi:MAG: hypothetical protein U0559_00200 [Anaerolineae bacterium]